MTFKFVVKIKTLLLSVIKVEGKIVTLLFI